MSNFGFALEGAWKVLAAGLILGAGLLALFALGIRSLAWGAGGDAEVNGAPPRPIGKVLAYALFAIVILGVLLGLTYIVASGFGKTISFDHFWPAIVDK
ncbi:hypothetical protein M1L60_11270 [Actinoplanes sp. TRM 88003]|uniref:Uncharacterized protein n=1 Tax=Paractinoplanes aksuensis TaxID=2939490 RepID=A0ABT1DJZ6_9ACTN|nr:hypothetical protein [Actinoplanes aksuensis]MCO8271173.1 hypothetical protein [Actinoplanes aksuensis]